MEGNKYADTLARRLKGVEQAENFVIFDTHPSDVFFITAFE